jgi:hypothetical protein
MTVNRLKKNERKAGKTRAVKPPQCAKPQRGSMGDNFYGQLLEKWCPNSTPEEALVCVFETVRDIPYGSTGEREPQKIVQENLGSCSGKHLLLSNLLNSLGYENKIVTCLHYFNDALPAGNDYPKRFKEILSTHRVIDFHHFVKLKRGRRWLNLDATWDALLHRFGFPVNFGWKGDTDTVVAVTPIKFYPETNDLISLKVKLIADMPKEDRRIREEFMRLLTEWLREIRSKE